MTAVSRRQLLTRAAAGGAAAAVLPLTAGVAGAAPAAPVQASPAYTFFTDSALNFQLLFVLGAAGYGAAETGETLATFDRIHARGDGYAVVYEEFLREGERLRRLGDEARARGGRLSAMGAYLRSAMYFDQALFFVLATAHPTRAYEGAAYRRMERSWALAMAQLRPRAVPVKIPYGRGTMPGWLLSADGAGPRSRRPTIILNNGSDAQNVDMWVSGGAAALERGWNALIFEGPGQGSELFLHSRPFTPRWERVVTSVVDFLRGRHEVDRRRIVLAGQSFGGYLVLRAAAFEHRLAAVVADPGVTDPFVSWQQSLPPKMLTLLEAGKRDAFDDYWREAQRFLTPAERFQVAKRSEIYGNGSLFERLTAARSFKLSRALARRIAAPTALLAPQDEQFFPGQAKTAYEWMRARRKVIRFTAAEGAQFHCEPMAPQLRNERVYDWLERNLEPVA